MKTPPQSAAIHSLSQTTGSHAGTCGTRPSWTCLSSEHVCGGPVAPLREFVCGTSRACELAHQNHGDGNNEDSHRSPDECRLDVLGGSELAAGPYTARLA